MGSDSITAFLPAPPQQPDDAYETGTPRNVQRQALFVFGSCQDFRRCEQLLFQTQDVRQLLRETEEGTIRFWSPKLLARPTLREERKTEASSLMALAIRQALAGPHKNGDKWIGRPVAKKVDQIYRGHLNSRNRRVAREGEMLDVFDDRRDYGDSWPQNEEGAGSFWSDQDEDWV